MTTHNGHSNGWSASVIDPPSQTPPDDAKLIEAMLASNGNLAYVARQFGLTESAVLVAIASNSEYKGRLSNQLQLAVLLNTFNTLSLLQGIVVEKADSLLPADAVAAYATIANQFNLLAKHMAPPPTQSNNGAGALVKALLGTMPTEVKEAILALTEGDTSNANDDD